MHVRRLAAGLLACVAFAACSDNSSAPTAPTTNDAPALARAHTGPLVKQLTDLAVTSTGTLSSLNIPVGTAGIFNGTLTITSFATNAAGQLVANGTLTGQAVFGGVTVPISQAFTNLVVTPLTQRCTILHLDLGPIFLNLLGLQLTTSPITLDLTAVAGAGNLLGNLLCAVAHLLDQNPLIPAIQNLLNQINAILGV